jgi:hypothetical protein
MLVLAGATVRGRHAGFSRAFRNRFSAQHSWPWNDASFSICSAYADAVGPSWSSARHNLLIKLKSIRGFCCARCRGTAGMPVGTCFLRT